MADQLAAQGIRFRDFRWDDIPALVDIRTRTSPEHPGSQERMEYFEKTYPADNPRLRYVVENAEGKCIGLGTCERSTFISVPGMYFMWIVVDPDYRGRGIARALLPRFEAYAREQGMEKLWASCKEDQDYSIRFLEKAGFYRLGQRFESMLDLTTFDESRFAGTLDRLQAAGFEFTTLAAERAINPQADWLLYEIDAETGREVPWPGGTHMEITYEQFRQRSLESSTADPTAMLIAKFQGRYAGLTMVEFSPGRPAHTTMTGVRREYRGQGLALGLKLLSFRLMQERGCTQTVTQNDTANPPILRLNEKLGYEKKPGILQWEKMLQHTRHIHD
jgi:ribosomal protein S18 acetylase RimI-like enzyme